MNIYTNKPNSKIIGVIIILLALVFLTGGTQPAQAASTIKCSTQKYISVDECRGLIQFYNSTNGDNWKSNAKWKEDSNPCYWHGVSCSGVLITSIKLADNSVSGELPPSINKLVNLRTLNLKDNKIGGVIPAELEDISGLKVLYLNNNQFWGNLPKELINIVKLEIFNVEGNVNLRWAIPPIYRLLSNMKQFMYKDTKLCTPRDNLYSKWEDGLDNVSRNGLFCDPLTMDSFESGNFSGWEDVINKSFEFSVVDEIGNRASCNLCVKKSAALVDQYGMQVNVPNNKARYVKLVKLDKLTSLNVRFYIDVSSLNMGNKSKFQVFHARYGRTLQFVVLIRKADNRYWVKAVTKTNSGKRVGTQWTSFQNKSTPIEVHWKAGIDPFKPDGKLKVFVGGILRVKRTKIANNKLFVTALRWGIAKKIGGASSVSGSFLLDHFGIDLSAKIGR